MQFEKIRFYLGNRLGNESGLVYSHTYKNGMPLLNKGDIITLPMHNSARAECYEIRQRVFDTVARSIDYMVEPYIWPDEEDW